MAHWRNKLLKRNNTILQAFRDYSTGKVYDEESEIKMLKTFVNDRFCKLPNFYVHEFTKNRDKVKAEFVGTYQQIEEELDKAQEKDLRAFDDAKSKFNKHLKNWKRFQKYVWSKIFPDLNEKQLDCLFDYLEVKDLSNFDDSRIYVGYTLYKKLKSKE